MENTTQLVNNKIDEDLFKSLGFVKVSDGFEKVVNGTKHHFYLGETDEEIGTNLEYRVNNRLEVSGYWHNRQDFSTNFQF